MAYLLFVSCNTFCSDVNHVLTRNHKAHLKIKKGGNVVDITEDITEG